MLRLFVLVHVTALPVPPDMQNKKIQDWRYIGELGGGSQGQLWIFVYRQKPE